MSYTTPNTSYTLLDPQTVNQVYYWRVQATSASGVVSQWSDVHQYMFQWPSVPGQPTPDQPNPAPMTPANGSTVTDVVFSWSAVSGAKNYELQVSPNGDWTNNKTIDATALTSTSYTPGEPLPNGSYFWRVRSIDAAGHFGTWSDPLTFTRQWIDRPVLQVAGLRQFHARCHPPHRQRRRVPVVGRRSRRAVRDAVRGRPELLADRELLHQPHRVDPYTQLAVNGHLAQEPGTCFNPGNVHVPIWTSGTTYYWRVRGIDNPTGSTDPWSRPPRSSGSGRRPASSSATPRRPRRPTPTDNATVSVPTMSWNAVAGAEKYQVTLKNKNGSAGQRLPGHDLRHQHHSGRCADRHAVPVLVDGAGDRRRPG